MEANPEPAAEFEMFDFLQKINPEFCFSALKSENFTQKEASILFGLYFASRERSDSIRPHYLAGLLHVKPSALSQILKQLEEKGYVERHRMSSDFRAVSLELTERGNQAAQIMEHIHKRLFSSLVVYVGREDLNRFFIILNKIIEFCEEKANAKGS